MSDDAADGAVERRRHVQPRHDGAAHSGGTPLEPEMVIRLESIADGAAGGQVRAPSSRGWQRPELVVIGLARRYR